MAALGVDATTSELRQELYRHESAFAATVHRTADAIYEGETERAIRERAIRWKINAVPTMHTAVFQLEPLAGLADAWGLTAQMERFLTTGPGKDLFGASQPLAVEASRELLTEVRALAVSVVGAERIRAVEPEFRAWLDENPITDVTFSRRSTAIDAASVTAREWGSGTLQSVGQIEDLLRDLSERLRIYGAELPELARAQAELLVLTADRDVLQPVWTNVDSIDRSVASAERTARNIDAFLASSPELIAAEREAVVEALQGELEATLVDIDRQRLQTLGTLSQERVAVFDELDTLRAAVLQDLETARDGATSDLEGLAERQARVLVHEAHGLVDMLFWRALILIAVGLVGLAIVLRVTRPTTTA